MINYAGKYALTWFLEVLLIVLPLIVLFLLLSFAEDKVDKHPVIFLTSFLIYIVFASIMFFYIPTKTMSFEPVVDSVPLGQPALLESIKKTFSQKNDEDKSLFEVVEKDNKIFVTWSNKINYNQIISLGGSEWKKVFIIKTNINKHIVYLSQKNVDWSWGATVKNKFSFSGSYFRGISVESEKLYEPSFIFNEDGSVSFEIKKLKYSSEDIMQPLLETLLSGGWTVKMSIL